MTVQCHAQVCAPQRPSENLFEQCCCIFPMCWPHTIRFSLVWSFERQPARTLLCEWRGTMECCAPVGAKEV